MANEVINSITGDGYAMCQFQPLNQSGDVMKSISMVAGGEYDWNIWWIYCSAPLQYAHRISNIGEKLY